MSQHSRKLSSEWTDISIDIEWGNLRAKRYGNGINRVLAVHGWLDNANSFDRIIPYLEDDLTLVALDLPGHGWSDHFQPGYKYDYINLVNALKKATMTLQWDSFIYLGHSFGAFLGLQYCSFFPEDIEAFISIDVVVPPFLELEACIGQYRKQISLYMKSDGKQKKDAPSYPIKDVVKMMIRDARSLDESSALLLLERGSEPVAEKTGEIKLSRDLRAKALFKGLVPRPFNISCARSICCPTLVINATHGYERDPTSYADMLEAYKENNKFFRFEVLEGDHHLHLTRSSDVGPVISKFIKDVLLLKQNKL